MVKLLSIVCLFSILTPLASAKIVFSSNRDGHYEVYVMDDDGRNVQRLTTTYAPLFSASPAWSPDGTQITFHRILNKEGNRITPADSDIFIMNSDGSELNNVTSAHNQNVALAWNPAWSPDGRRIAFAGKEKRDSLSRNIFVIHLSSKRVTNLTNNKTIGKDANDPAWSPDGTRIAFIQSAPRFWHTIYTMNSNGKNRHSLIREDLTYRFSPKWAANGTDILFGEGEGVPDQLVIQNSKTRTRKIITLPEAWIVSSVCWMGRRNILVSAYEEDKPDQNYDIYKYNLFSENFVRLTDSPDDETSPDWISDSVLPVEPAGKISTKWGTLKRTGQ